MTRIVVVGAGIGGLTCAALLVRRGFAVTVVEAAAVPGGKIRRIDTGGVAVDAGPTVFTMRWVFDELFEACGGVLGEAVQLVSADILARHAWGPGEVLDLFADDAASAAAIAAFAGAREAAGFRSFMAEARRTLRTLERPFLRGGKTSALGLAARVGVRRASDLASIHPYSTLWGRLGRHFGDPRLKQLFGRYATYSGSSPWQAPATLMLIAAVEADGVWLIDGGLYALACAVEALGRQSGAEYRYGCSVAEADARGVTLASGERIDADAVVWNGDPQALEDAGVRRAVPTLSDKQRSLSALVWTIDAETAGFPLVRHNVFFSDDYAREFGDLREGRAPADPSIYVCAQDRGGACRDAPASGGDAPHAGPERLQLIVNAPPIRDGDGGKDDIERCEAATFERLRRCGLALTARAQVLTRPADFAARFPGSRGSLYGAATHGAMAAFRRPGARTKLPWLYLAGGSTHPGAGVPMAALSGMRAAEAVAADRAST